jgi:hypothetical protein
MQVENPNYDKVVLPKAAFTSFNSFYPFYLGEHRNRINRRLHLLGTTIAFFSLSAAIYLKDFKLFLFGSLQGYALAWIGHFKFEKNKPATFKYPLYSLAGDWKMWFEHVTLRRQL